MTPTAEAYVQSALASVKYTSSLATTGYRPHSLADAALNLITHISSRHATARYMQASMEKYRKHLIEVHASNANGVAEARDVNFWKVLS